jgi:hypothetical protein
VFAFTEDLKDSVLCPMNYFAEGQCVAFVTRQPYPIIQTFMVDSWEHALEKAACLRDEFAAALASDELP